LSWIEQIRIVSNARFIVAPHGMALTHLVFNVRRPRVIEMFNPTIFSDAYALLSKAFGHDYGRIIGEEVGGSLRNFRIEPGFLLDALKRS
jgi:capsular polysaccharide biosynthesis protein